MVISTPSYLFPGTYLENIRYIHTMPEINSVELLFFIFDEETKLLYGRERRDIEAFYPHLRFTVHMPDELLPEHEALIEMTAPIATHYILHPPAEDTDRFLHLVTAWRKTYGEKFLLENLIERDFEGVLNKLGPMGVCCDTGHLLIRGRSPAWFCETYGESVREVHLHGTAEGWDHKPFDDEAIWFRDLVPFLKSFSGVVNLELFAVDDVNKMLEVLKAVELIP